MYSSGVAKASEEEMPVSIVVGGQFGSEGKGKVAHYLAREMEASFAVRCGGPNSGHTVIDRAGNARIFQQLPTASILDNVKLAICAGSYIDLDILFKEIRETGIDSSRLIIDPDALIITDEIKLREAESGIINRIGSTGSGTGAAVVARLNREESLVFARNVDQLSQYIQNVPDILRECLVKNERLIVEGTQGFGLSPLHARYYPYATSRDTTAAAFLAETGLSPLDVDDIILTIRAFPIRVAGNSGPIPNEITWNQISQEEGTGRIIQELSSVTKRVRRVANFDSEIVLNSIKVNNPSRVVLNHLDYLPNERVYQFFRNVEHEIMRKIDFFGFSQENLLERHEFINRLRGWE